MKKEKSELDIVLKFIDYIHYSVSTPDKIKLDVTVRKPRYSITPIFKWEGEVSWVIAESVGDFAGEYKTIFRTEQPTELEYCLEEVNEFIEQNFKTRLDDYYE